MLLNSFRTGVLTNGFVELPFYSYKVRTTSGKMLRLPLNEAPIHLR